MSRVANCFRSLAARFDPAGELERRKVVFAEGAAAVINAVAWEAAVRDVATTRARQALFDVLDPSIRAVAELQADLEAWPTLTEELDRYLSEQLNDGETD